MRKTMAAIAAVAFTFTLVTPTFAHHTGGGSGGVGGAPIITIPAITLPKDRFAASVRVDYDDFDRFSDDRLRDFAVQGIDTHSIDYVLITTYSAAYGITDDITVGTSIPYSVTQNVRVPAINDDTGEPEVGLDGDTAGVGDATVFGEWRFVKLDDIDLCIALIAGVQIPTGFDHARTREGRRFEVEQQPGSGAWDPLFGLAISKAWGRFSAHAEFEYTFAGQGSQETDLGDRFNGNLAFVYHVGGPEPGAHDAAEKIGPTWDFALEFNGEHTQKIRIAGIDDPNSGGNLLLLSPGLRFNLNEHWSIFGSVGIPIWQDVNGHDHELDYKSTFGVGIGF